jgi:hypothetical protein
MSGHGSRQVTARKSSSIYPVTECVSAERAAAVGDSSHNDEFVFAGVHSGLNAGPINQPGSGGRRCLCAEAFFQFSQNVDLRDLFEFAGQGRLEHAYAKNALAQSRATARAIRAAASNWEQIGRRLPTIRSQSFFGQAAPFGNDGSA